MKATNFIEKNKSKNPLIQSSTCLHQVFTPLSVLRVSIKAFKVDSEKPSNSTNLCLSVRGPGYSGRLKFTIHIQPWHLSTTLRQSYNGCRRTTYFSTLTHLRQPNDRGWWWHYCMCPKLGVTKSKMCHQWCYIRVKRTKEVTSNFFVVDFDLMGTDTLN